MDLSTQKRLIDYLKQFVTQDRFERLEEVLGKRTRSIAVVLEDIYQPHNASAVLRSCDGFGVQDVHIIENRNRFDVSRGVTIGADQWLTLHRYGDAHAEEADYTERCLSELRSQGYQIVATTPHGTDVTIDQLSVRENMAIVFGAEYEGLTPTAMEFADHYVRIPMVGFSESFNISVSAALVLYELTRRVRRERNDWKLSDTEQTELMLQWLKESIRGSEKLEEKFFEKGNNEG